jgi:hypothetical protein
VIVGSLMLFVLFVSNELGTKFVMSHYLSLTIVFLNKTFKSEKKKLQKTKSQRSI